MATDFNSRARARCRAAGERDFYSGDGPNNPFAPRSPEHTWYAEGYANAAVRSIDLPIL